MTKKITFTNHSVKSFHLDRMRIKGFLSIIFLEEGFDYAEVKYIFCTDEYLLRLNKEFLNHDTYTDILTFSMSDLGKPIFAEIYISTERVNDNALGLGVNFIDELYRVIIHGVLHLCGYADDTFILKKAMTAKEDYYLGRLCST